jgi:hypothetical protein
MVGGWGNYEPARSSESHSERRPPVTASDGGGEDVVHDGIDRSALFGCEPPKPSMQVVVHARDQLPHMAMIAV